MKYFCVYIVLVSLSVHGVASLSSGGLCKMMKISVCCTVEEINGDSEIEEKT